MKWQDVQITLIIVVAAIIVSLGVSIIIKQKREGKFQCIVDNEILWKKKNQWQLWDIWSCKKHFDEAKKEARKNLGALPNELTREILEETYRILKNRSR